MLGFFHEGVAASGPCPLQAGRKLDGWRICQNGAFAYGFHLGVAQNLRAGVTQVLVSDSIYQVAILVRLSEPQPFECLNTGIVFLVKLQMGRSWEFLKDRC